MSIGDGAFSQCSELTAITVSPDNPYFTAVNNVLFSKDQTHLICYPIGKQFTENEYVIPNSVLRIGDYAFRDSGLISVTIPDSVTSIGDYAFYSCSALTSVTIPDSIISIGDGAFSFCEELRTIAVNADNPYFTVKEDVLFSKNPMRLICYPVGKQDTEYIVPDGVTSIGECAFLKSPGLTSVTLPESVTDIDGGGIDKNEIPHSQKNSKRNARTVATVRASLFLLYIRNRN